jgi:hypothetical protein
VGSKCHTSLIGEGCSGWGRILNARDHTTCVVIMIRSNRFVAIAEIVLELDIIILVYDDLDSRKIV